MKELVTTDTEARDEKDPIGRGKHERFAVKRDRFEKALEEEAGS